MIVKVINIASLTTLYILSFLLSSTLSLSRFQPMEDTDSPTHSPGAVELFLCTQDPKPPSDKFCEKTLISGMYYTTNEECLVECWGMIACPSIVCVTESPTLSPTISTVPTTAPTASTVPTTVEPTTDSPTTLSPASSAPTALPSVYSSEFSFSVTTNGGQDPIEAIPLSPFRLDFILRVDGGDENDTNNNNDGKRRRALLRENDARRKLLIFQPAHDAQLLSLVSDHLLDQFTNKLVGKPISVELGIDDKAEQNVRDGKVMVSYGYIGHAVYAAAKNVESDALPRLLPSMADVDGAVLSSFNSRQGKRAWLNAVQYSEDDVLQGMVNVIASNNPIMTVNQAAKNENQTDLVGSTSTAKTAIINPIMAVIAVAFATTLLVIGFLTYRKYQKYKRSNASNDNVDYQSRKRKGAIEINVKNGKRYDHFESPVGSVVAPSEEHLNDLEIVGGDTYPASQDYSDAEQGNNNLESQQFHPHDGSLPYDEATQQNNTAAASASMVYYSHAANQMMNESKNGDDETLEGLYSDKDSYFQSTFAPSVNGRQMQGEGIQSVHSLDTLDTTFGYTTVQSMDALDNPEDTITHLIEGFEEIVDRNEREHSSRAGFVVPYMPTTLLSTDNIGGADACILPRNDVVEQPTSEEGDESIKTETPSSTSETSDTDELFARITELENKMIQTESSLKTSTFDETSDSADELYSQITELENKMCQTESKLASVSNDEMDTKPIDLTVPPNTPTVPVNTLEGVFTAETLVKIEENRLKCTPPPSEGEVDNDIIKAAKENTLLGKFLDESSDDDSSMFELV